MDYEIQIGASRQRLQKLTQEIELACMDKGTIDLTVYAKGNSSAIDEVRLMFSNDDMEDREDLGPDAILVDIEEA